MKLYHRWLDELQMLWPDEHASRLKSFAKLLVGLYLEGSVHLKKVARKVPGWAQQTSKERGLLRILNNRCVNVRLWYKPVARRLLEQAAKSGLPLRLIIDGSQVGNGHQLLMVALAFRRRALPLIWTWRKGTRGHSSARHQIALLRLLKPLIPAHASVVVLGDSEFGSVKLIRKLEHWRWTYVLRQKGSHLWSQPGTEQWQPCAQLVAQPGDRCWLPKVLLTKTHGHFCNLFACWQTGYKEPWLLATNLTDPRLVRLHYSRRMWIEELFGDCKRNGFDLEATRLQAAHRLSRLVLAVALLIVWLLAFGSAVVKRGQRFLVDRTDRRDLSLFRIGWDMVQRLLSNSDPVPLRLIPYF